MTLHIVLGDGEMTTKELTETLNDLHWNAAENDEAFWLIVQGKSDPSATDKALMKWVSTNEVYFEVLTDDADAVDGIYSASQNTHVAKGLAAKVIKLLNDSPDDGEEADILGLFVSTDPDAAEDKWLNGVVGQAFDAGFKTFALNDGMIEVEMGDSPDEEEAEVEDEAPAKAPAKKAAAKKAAAPAEEAAPIQYSREELEDMDLKQLKEVAVSLGIELPARTRPKTYVDAILGEGKTTPEAEVEPEPFMTDASSPNGHVDIAAIVDEVTTVVIRKIVDALLSTE